MSSAIHADADLATKTFGVTFGAFTQTTPWTDRRGLSWQQLVDVTTNHRVGAKEGTCIVPARFRSVRRITADADQIDVAMLDSDAGATLEMIADALRAKRRTGIVSSSYSHMTTITKVKREHWLKFRTTHPDGDAAAYLIAKGMLPHVTAGAVTESEDADYVRFRHAPCPRFRVIVPLLHPWRAAHYPSQDAANAAWKGAIEALAAALGLQHDQSCVDTSRLFFLPRHPANGPPPERCIIKGRAPDIFTLPAARPADPLFRHRSNGASPADHEAIDPETGELFDLVVWARDYAERFQIAKALKARRAAALTGRVADRVKVHIECPNSAAHTEAGADGATFVCDARTGRNKGFVIHCRHAHCDGQDRLFFITTMLEQKWLAIADLTNPEFLVGATDGASGNPKPNGAAGSASPAHEDEKDHGEDAGSPKPQAEGLHEVTAESLAADRAKVEAKVAAEIAQFLAEFNAKYMVVNEAGKTLIYTPTFDPLLRRRRFDRSTFDDFRRLHLNRTVVVGLKNHAPVYGNAAEFWLKHRKRREYLDGVVFDPSGGSDSGTLNLWQGFAVKPARGDWSLMQHHMVDVICNKDTLRYEYLTGWLARMVQYPAQQGEVALVMKGLEGCGKGVVARTMLHILGPHGLQISNARHLVGNFNGHLRDCVYLFADEAFFAGDKQHVGVLKSIITEPYLTVEAKYKNTIQTPNFLHVVLASNEDWVVPASIEARRFFVLLVANHRIRDFPYFQAIAEQMEAGGYEAMLYDLLHLDISTFNVRNVPVTDGLQQQQKRSFDTTNAWWFDVLHRGYVFRSRLGLEDHFGQWHDNVATELLFVSYSEFAQSRRERHPLSREYLGRWMIGFGAKSVHPRNLVIGEHITDVETGFGGTTRKAELIRHPRPPAYHFGSLDEARDAFEKTTGLQFDWQNQEQPDDA